MTRRYDSKAEVAVEKYREFHRLDPRDVGAFAASLEIPEHVVRVGASIEVLYRSGKVDPETLRKPKRPLNYIHDHDAGVSTYVLEGDDAPGAEDADPVEVPFWIREVQALTLLGQCLGFAYQPDEGDRVDAEGTSPLPELYCTPDGRALLVIQGRRDLVALMWGGTLGVEARGIVG